jgi:hypothetical protein
LSAEKLLAAAGQPDVEGCKITLDQWQALADRTVRYKETVDRALSALGLDPRSEPRDWYDQIIDEQRREDQRKLTEQKPAKAEPVVEDSVGIDIDAQDDPQAAAVEDRSLAEPQCDVEEPPAAVDDAEPSATASSATPSALSPVGDKRASAAACLPNAPVDDAATGQGTTANGIGDRQADDDVPF